MSSVPPVRKSLTCHNHHVVETFFSEPWNLEYISITNFSNRMCSSTQNPTWLSYWLALLAQVPRLGDVQLLFHMGIMKDDYQRCHVYVTCEAQVLIL